MAVRFNILPTGIADLTVIERLPRGDARGFLSRFFCAEELSEAGFTRPIAQINHTLTREAGAIRGMHFQYPPHGEDKIVSCIRGAVFDVAVDLRAGSPTFLQWHAEILSAENSRSLMIPKGFAHGFQTMTTDCELIYLHSYSYVPDSEGALNAQDPKLGIIWPLPVTEMSVRDKSHPFVGPEFKGVSL